MPTPYASARFIVLSAALLAPIATASSPRPALAEPGATPPPAAAPPLAAPPPEPAAAPSLAAEPPESRSAGWYDDVFYVRDAGDDFRLYLQGRANIDAYVPFGPGLSDLGPGNALESTIFLRRVRPEIAGEFLHIFQFKIEGDWGQSASENTNGQTAQLSCTVDPQTGAQTCTPRTSAIESPTQRPSSLDVYVNWAAAQYFNIQIGQFKVPFSLENRTSENFTPFLEASLPIRDVGAPFNRDIGAMAWGETERREVYYGVGVFDGDGPNRLNPDDRFDVIGRVFAHPFARTSSPLEHLQIGASARAGSRDLRRVGYDYPGLSTQGGYLFWKPAYVDSAGRLVHVIPSGRQRSLAGELYLPIERLELTAELVYIDNHTREAADGYQLSPFTERFGTLHGTSYYVEAGVWIVGDRSMIGRPGYLSPTHIDFTKPPRPVTHGLEALAKIERIRLSYDGGARAGSPSGLDGEIRVDAVSVGANYWFSRHLRLSANYGFYRFPDSAPVSASPASAPRQTPAQRAIAPAQNLPKGVNDDARTNGHILHELMFRVGVAI